MDFRILGPLQVTAEDGPVVLGGRRQRLLLAVLLANPDRSVPLERLVDAMWEESPPTTARRQVQNCAAAIRRQLNGRADRDLITVSVGPSYRIQPGVGRLDAQVFADRLGTARRLSTGTRARPRSSS